MHLFSKSDSVARPLAFAFAAQWLLLQVVLWIYPGPFFLLPFTFGIDFRYFYDAAGHFLAGRSPYLEINFYPLPPALYLPMTLHHLPFATALWAYRIISATLVIAAMFWLCRQLKLTALNTAVMMLITLTYGPFYSELADANLDALVLAMLVAACVRRPALRAAYLALSVGTKVYSALLIPVLALRRRWRELLWTAAVLLLLHLPFLLYLPGGISSVLHRSTILHMNGNQSPAVLFILLFGAGRVRAWRAAYVILWGGTLLLRMAKDAKNKTRSADERFLSLTYLPWMAAAPVQVYYYTSTILLPVIAVLIRTHQHRRLNWAEWTMAAGFFLTGLYPWVFLSVLPLTDPNLARAAATPMLLAAVGVTAMIIAAAWQPAAAMEVGPPEQKSARIKIVDLAVAEN